MSILLSNPHKPLLRSLRLLSPLLSGLFVLITASTLSYAQSEESPDSAQERIWKKNVWQASLPGGEYLVYLHKITAISMHSYLLDGAIVVTEVTIDTTGTTVARFYQITPVNEYSKSSLAKSLTQGTQRVVEQAQEHSNLDPSTTVQKKYPLTTHAKTIEYQLSDLNDLHALFKSLKQSWKTERGRQFVVTQNK